MWLPSIILCTLAILHSSSSASIPKEAELVPIQDLQPRQVATTTTRVADSQCTNGPATRQCWGNGFSVNTNYDNTWPDTKKVVKYNLEITNTTMALDGTSRVVYAINGQYPGPTIIADWGDTLEITVKNSLTTNGTSIHWHGLRQWQTNHMDGTNGITECPLAPGQSKVYKFLCTQFGTTWYHSHYSGQYSDGVVGTMIINGPASSNYDVDLGTLPINDWYYTTAFTLGPLIQFGGFPRGPPPAENILINGTNVNATGGGRYHVNSLTKGKKYRVRLINTSTNDNFKVGLDNHTMTVITADFVPIVPWQTQWLNLNIGQRYDVIINANQPISSYWFHVIPNVGCSNNKVGNALSIFTYSGASSSIPPNSTRNNSPVLIDCNDSNGNLTPYVKANVPTNITIPNKSRLDVGFAIVTETTSTNATNTVFQWNINSSVIQAPWDKPTIQYVLDSNTNYPPNMNLIALPKKNAWSFWIIQAIKTTPPPIAHPIHLHGHDFYVMGAGSGIYSSNTTLNFINPPRRDVAMLPAGGYLVIAFITDNPGAWLMHCHIAWHIGLGLGVQFLERADDIAGLGMGSTWTDECKAWNSYYETAQFKEEDSGL